MDRRHPSCQAPNFGSPEGFIVPIAGAHQRLKVSPRRRKTPQVRCVNSARRAATTPLKPQPRTEQQRTVVS